MAKFDPSSITQERTLWSIWKQARRIRRSRFNEISTGIVVVLLSVFAMFSHRSAHDFAEMVRVWANIGLGFAATILGFLVAGFTIFATLSKPSLLSQMAQTTEPKSQLSYLKYNFSAFFEVFGYYVSFRLL
jgi:hypothetical protein